MMFHKSHAAYVLLAATLLPPAPADATTNDEAAPGEVEGGKTIDAHVYHCNDGDTCRLRIGEAMWMNVRLAAIDAPETAKGKKDPNGQVGGVAARDKLNALVKGKAVKVRQVDLDQYNRPVVEILLGTQLVNHTLISEGYAEVYRGKTKRLDKSGYFAAEEGAKKAKKGIWGQKDYESPADYRKSLKK